MPPPAPLSTALTLVAPIGGYSDASPTGEPTFAYLLPSRLSGLALGADLAQRHPGHPFGLFGFVDAFCLSPACPPPPYHRPGRSTRRLIAALADYLGAPPRDADGPQLNAARALHLTLHTKPQPASLPQV